MKRMPGGLPTVPESPELPVRRTIGRRTLSEASPLSFGGHSSRDMTMRRSSYGSFLTNLGFLKNSLNLSQVYTIYPDQSLIHSISFMRTTSK
jgi:hypothetical protein